ncbi:MAG: hypothetical protein K8R67_04905 [Desulfobacteraceae bacterium]|nr:hypothetical protein [Desulfobacteraceae bacterium]
MFRFFSVLFILLFLIFQVAPYPAQAYDLEKHIGLYKVIETKCKFTKGLYNPCPEIKFFELVKGRFYDMGSDDMAFVHWKIDQDDPIAGYEAGLVKNHKKLLMHDNKIWLTDRENKTEAEKEFFILKDGKISGYQFIYSHKNKAGKTFSRNFYYKLTPTSRDEIGNIKLLYPDHSDDTLKALPSFDEDRKFYKNSNDSILKKAVIDKDLYSTFFDSHEAFYKWYIIKNDDGTFENTMGGEISKEDKIPIQHTSNCVSTHQGQHSMNFCDANLKSGVLQLKIHGGLPAYLSTLLIEVKENNEFSCFFKAVYPVLVPDLKWNILSKKLRLKTSDFKKGKQIFGWLSVEFEETSTYKGEKAAKIYKIEGFIKPVVN